MYDIRMSTELLSYIRTDWDTYVTRDMGGRLFRKHQNFHDVAQYTAMKVYKKYPTYIFIGPERESIYPTVLRYYSFPYLPVTLDAADRTEKTVALIYHREDITLNEDGHLVQNGELLFGNDTLLQQFDPHSFLVALPPL